MEERIVKAGPGVLIGISMEEPHPGIAEFYDGHKLRITVDLAFVGRVRDNNGLIEPGTSLDMFFKKSIIMKYPKGVDIDVMTD